MKTNKLLKLLPLLLVPYLHVSGQELGLANFDTVGISQYFNCEDNFDSIVYSPPSIDYIKIVLSSLTGDEPVRFSGNINYLFPITVKDGDHCERIIVTPNALYDSYGKANGMDLNTFRKFLIKTMVNDDTILLSRPYPIILFSANYQVISYNYPDFLFFRDDPIAFIRHFFCNGSGSYYYCIVDQACVVEQLYHWGILVTDADGADSGTSFYLGQSDLVRFVKLFPESEKEKKWKEVFQNKKTLQQGIRLNENEGGIISN